MTFLDGPFAEMRPCLPSDWLADATWPPPEAVRRSFGVMTAEFDASVRPPKTVGSGFYSARSVVLLAGWPSPCLVGACAQFDSPEHALAHGLVTLDARAVPTAAPREGDPKLTEVRLIPLRPLWSGALKNTLFYSVAASCWMLLIAAPGRHRSTRLLNRLCDQCFATLAIAGALWLGWVIDLAHTDPWIAFTPPTRFAWTASSACLALGLGYTLLQVSLRLRLALRVARGQCHRCAYQCSNGAVHCSECGALQQEHRDHAASRLIQTLSRRLTPARALAACSVMAALLAIGLVVTNMRRSMLRADARLHAAAMIGDMAELEAALQEGASPNAPDPMFVRRGLPSPSPLSVAVFAGHFNCAILLVESGADANAVNPAGYSVLYFAVAHPELTTLLLNRGADARACASRETSALVQAAGLCKLRSVRALLVAGAAANDQCVHDALRAATAFVMDTEHIDIEETGLPADRVQEAVVLELLRHTDSGHDDFGAEILLAVAKLGFVDAARAMLASGANPHARTSDGATTLMNAASSGSLEMVSLLLACGVDVHATDASDRKARDYASQAPDTNAHNIARIESLLVKDDARDVKTPKD
jgi:hypothetical protein